MVTIRQDAWLRLLAHCRSTLPEEACGVLYGDSRSDGGVRVERVIPVANVAEDRLHYFTFDPSEWVKLYFRSLDGGKHAGIVGIYHSHPHAEAVPSRHDMERLHYNFPTYWIVSMTGADAAPDVRAYQNIRAEGPWSEIPIRLA